ncbi:hypothetical protein TorRG33x02_119220 [Trema orientale]|uniref:Uncharacterized protein n=1 Tax=Trema orientale TaxID=63057 RepID=A0A2P5F3C0_TREOI|nr:hypothetical protein TorRG33x02_119220 [Trema orientale]
MRCSPCHARDQQACLAHANGARPGYTLQPGALCIRCPVLALLLRVSSPSSGGARRPTVMAFLSPALISKLIIFN